jgi:ribosomal protein S18 acetylase RimI-like enzyme
VDGAREEAASSTTSSIEAARGSGVAVRLAEADRVAGRAGMPRVLLWTVPQNEAARRLFNRLGFRQTMMELTREL